MSNRNSYYSYVGQCMIDAMQQTLKERLFTVTEHGGINPEEESPRFVAKHLSAYYFAKRFADGSVLEIGSGDGYGASLLAETANEVTGIDLFQKNVDLARSKYKRSNLKFLKMSATALDLSNQSFDLVVSFQVIEHIPQGELLQYISEIKRTLKKDGKACLSTLNLKKNQKPGQPYDKSPHHDKEFMPSEFKDFLAPLFRRVELYGLYPTPKHLFFERVKKSGLNRLFPSHADPIKQYFDRMTISDFRWLAKTNLEGCMDLMAVCHA